MLLDYQLSANNSYLRQVDRMRVTRLLGSSSKSLLQMTTISMLAISLLIGTGEARISLANNNAASEVVDSKVLHSVSHSNVTRGLAQVANIPGRIEAEDYKPGGEGVGYHDISPGNSGGDYRSDDVDIDSTSDVGGGFKIVSTASGEWLAYDILVDETWKYDITARVVSGDDGPKSFHIEVDGEDVTGIVSFTDASGYDSFVDITVKDITLRAGPHELRFFMGTGFFNFNYLDVAKGSAPAIPTTIRVLPLGDSITHGNRKSRTYRYPLWTKLIDSGLNFDGIHFDLVGSQNSNHNGDPLWPDYRGHAFDRDHEGHWGWRAEQVLGGLPAWLEGYTPDIVLLHLGTNDVFDNQTTLSTISEIGQIIDVLRADNPTVIVLLAKILPTLDPASNQRIDELNQQIDSIAVLKSTPESPVVVVDQNLGFSAGEDTYDGIHPNLTGEEKMAQKCYDAIIEVLLETS
jgi:lysophospholipase L1-like esterase